MAVADVYTALTEDRPYREGMPEKRAFEIIDGMAGSALDPHVISVLHKSRADLNSTRKIAGREATKHYRRFHGSDE